MYFGFNLSLGGVGSYVGSRILANILYNMNGFKYVLDENSEVYVNNKGSNTNNDLLLYSGEPLEVAVGNEFDVPLDYNLGSERYVGITAFAPFIVTDLGNGDKNVKIETSGTGSGLKVDVTVSDNELNIYEFTAVINSGELSFDRYYDGTTFKPLPDGTHTIVSGLNKIKVYGRNTSSMLWLNSSGAMPLADIDFTDNSVKEITSLNTKSLLTHTIENGWTHVTELSGTTYTVPQNTYSQLFTVNSLVTEADLALMNSDIDIVAREALDGNTALSFSQGDIKGYYQPMRYQGGYLQNMMVDLGSEIHDGTATENNSVGGAITDFTSQATGFDLAVTTIGTDNRYPRVTLNYISALTVGNTYKISIPYSLTSGTCQFVIFQQGAYGSTYDISGSGTIDFLYKATVADTFLQFRFDGRNLFDVSFSECTVKEVEAIAIPNDSVTQYTNNDFNPKGHQTTHYTYDDSGRVTAINDDRLNFYGNSYGDTGWIPPSDEDFTVELVQEFVTDGSYHLNGVEESGTDRFMIGENSTSSRASLYANGPAVHKYGVAKGNHHLCVTKEGSIFKFYFDGVYVGTLTQTISFDNSFTLGQTSTGLYRLESPIPYFNVHENKAMTAEEVAEAYADAKKEVPTLP